MACRVFLCVFATELWSCLNLTHYAIYICGTRIQVHQHQHYGLIFLHGPGGCPKFRCWTGQRQELEQPSLWNLKFHAPVYFLCSQIVIRIYQRWDVFNLLPLTRDELNVFSHCHWAQTFFSDWPFACHWDSSLAVEGFPSMKDRSCYQSHVPDEK